MARLSLLAGGILLASGMAADAEVPRVVTDIAPVHSLVAQVMGDLGTPELILPPGASPHGYALRPSDARALSRADFVFWIGPELTPWLEGAIASLSGNAVVSDLMDVPGTTLIEYRDGEDFGEDSGEEGQDDHAEHAEAHDHARHGHDPHAWLDPQNAIVWLRAISGMLAEADAGNAGTYAANAQAAVEHLRQLSAEIDQDLAPVRDLSFVVFHDAFGYFENRFDIHAAGAISLGDATDPGAARISEIRKRIVSLDVTCIATEPQFNPGIVKTVAGGQALQVTILDPLGVGLTPGPELYQDVLRGLAEGLLACR